MNPWTAIKQSCSFNFQISEQYCPLVVKKEKQNINSVKKTKMKPVKVEKFTVVLQYVISIHIQWAIGIFLHSEQFYRL